ncbi:endonuclease NucS [Methanobacterium alkalithermotolerans]|uniref:Endonuclease NucS n=1 Tax=Methanobacterium alkalithermotolerans TaxID=2731220 RepID=A0A8T8K7J1_9EURY|nr:endonuclease NucS [Methanobacterium alkalithermotolerans]QUH23802.1 endonuclease NucS [Methanobacterium alkalithermotolerans]
MKFISRENPSPSDCFRIIDEGLRKRAVITLFACCQATYEGRARSKLGLGERMIIIKPDGSFLIHQDRKLDPVNWQPPKSRSKVRMENGIVILESVRRTPPEHLEVEIKNVHLVSYYLGRDSQELEVCGHEKDMGEMIWKHPELIEKGFRPTDKEYSTSKGFIDILGKDENGQLMILELKSRKAGTNAVKQLKRYLKDFEDNKGQVRGIIVAPSITEDALELLEEDGLEFKSLEPPKELKEEKKVTLDFF